MKDKLNSLYDIPPSYLELYTHEERGADTYFSHSCLMKVIINRQHSISHIGVNVCHWIISVVDVNIFMICTTHRYTIHCHSINFKWFENELAYALLVNMQWNINTYRDAVYKHENKWAAERTGLQVICFSISGGNEKLFAMKKGFFCNRDIIPIIGLKNEFR